MNEPSDEIMERARTLSENVEWLDYTHRALEIARALMEAEARGREQGAFWPGWKPNPEIKAVAPKGFTLLTIDETKAALLAAAREEGRREERAKNDAEWNSLVPLLDAGMFECPDTTLCEMCGAPLIAYDETASVEDFTGCWRAATGRDSDPCPGDGRKRLGLMIREALDRFREKSRATAIRNRGE